MVLDPDGAREAVLEGFASIERCESIELKGDAELKAFSLRASSPVGRRASPLRGKPPDGETLRLVAAGVCRCGRRLGLHRGHGVRMEVLRDVRVDRCEPCGRCCGIGFEGGRLEVSEWVII